MAKWFNNFLVKTVPMAPKFMVGLVAKKYVSGETLQDAVRVIRDLNAKGFTATADVLGEHIHDLSETELPVEMYLDLTETISSEQIDSNVSLKLTQLGLEIDSDRTWENFEKILVKIKEQDNFLRIDMEDSSLTDVTLEFFKRAKLIYKNVGFVIQSYLHRSEKDIRDFLSPGINVRICKGIYKESPDIAFQDPVKIRENFLLLVKLLLENDSYAAIATHDLIIIDACEKYIKSNNIPTDRYEFQALYGVPIHNTLKRLVSDGHTVRIYVPYGKDWYPYSMRRLKENPDLAGYIFKDFFNIKSK